MKPKGIEAGSRQHRADQSPRGEARFPGFRDGSPNMLFPIIERSSFGNSDSSRLRARRIPRGKKVWLWILGFGFGLSGLGFCGLGFCG